MARMKAMEVPQRATSGSDDTSEPIAPLPNTRGSTPENKPTRKPSFRVLRAGKRRKEGRSSALRQSTVAALTSKFNALNHDSQRLVIHEDPKSKGGGRYSVVLEPRHPTLVARISATNTTSPGGVKAAIQIFEKNVVQPSESSVKQKNIKNVITSKKSNSIIVTAKGKNLKFDIKNNDILNIDLNKKSVIENKKSHIIKKSDSVEKVVVPILPKPNLKSIEKSSVKISVPIPPKPDLKPVQNPPNNVEKSVPPKPEPKPTRTLQIASDFEKSFVKPSALKSAKSLSSLVPPKPKLYNISTLHLPLINSPKPSVQSSNSVVIESVKVTKPEVPVKNKHIIKEFLEANNDSTIKNNKPNKPLISELKPNKSSLFLPLIKSTPSVQSKPALPAANVDKNNKIYVRQSTENLKSILKPPSPDLSPKVKDVAKEMYTRSQIDLTEDDAMEDDTPTQETSLMTEVLNALAENKILTPILSNTPGFIQYKAESDVPSSVTPETPKVLPNASFLWSSGVTKRDDQEEEGEAYDDVYVSARNSYAALRLSTLPRVPSRSGSDIDEDGAYEYCLGAAADSNSYDDCLGGAANLIYDDVKSLAATSNCYESIGSCAPSYCEKNNSLYGLPDELRGQGGTSSSGCSLGSSSPRVGSRASTISAEGEGPHEVFSYQLLDQFNVPDPRVGDYTPQGERPSEAGSDEWVDIELSESEEQLGPPVDLQETIVIVRERSRTRRSPSWSHKVRRQWSKSPKKRANMPSTEESTSSDSDHHYETLYEAVGESTGDATLKPTVTPAPPALLDEDEAFDSDITDSSFDSDTSEETPVLRPHAQIMGPRSVELPPELPDTLPPPPPGTKKINKIAEAAGKKMRKLRKNFTLRKQDFSDRLRRLSVTNPLPTPSPTTETPPPLPPAAAPPLLEKAVSTGNLTGRKYWSFKDKFNRQASNPSLKNGSQERSSVFYVSPSNEQPDTDLGDRDNPNRRSTTESVCSSGRGSSAGSEVETAPRRLSRTTVRPKTPPPPPPTELKNLKNGGKPSSWYADIEISSLQPTRNDSSSENIGKNGHSIEGDLSWYSEIGLDNSVTYSQNGGSLADSSHTTTSSESSNTSPDGSVVHGCFADEPLYQFYAASVLEQAKRDLSESDSDGYEEIGESGRLLAQNIMVSRPSAMELIRPRETSGHRTLWCEVPDVIDSGVLATLSQQERKLQEAKFEVITSEASYFKSLNILATHFVQCPEFQDESILSKTDKHILFSNILPVKACSERFLAELERCWQDNIMLPEISEVVYKHATKHFRVYVKYCSHQIYLDRTLRKLKENSNAFSEALARLESAPECQSLSLHSFLMLPMQRVTRLPLLLDAVIRRLSARDDEYDACKMALFALNKVVQECNEGARCMERMEEMLLLSRQLEFKDIRAVPLISSTRWLVRSGELTQLTWRDEAKLTFGRRFGKLPVCVFLFTDLLIVAKRKGDESFQVLDYCARNMVQVTCPEEGGEGALTQLPVRLSQENQGKHLLLLTLLQNHDNRTVEMVLSCSLESDRQRWLSAFTPIAAPENPEERVYEEWDCPQVQAIHAYVARQPDELSLDVADVVNVLRKLPDGWYQGERIRDGERGWFPGNYCKEVLSSHVRARNLRQRYRLLALSREYIEQQQRAMQEQRKARRASKSNKTVSPA